MSAKKTANKQEDAEWKNHRCGECAEVTEVMRFHTLSVKGEPTLGECPNWTKSKCVLLSQQACKQFKNRNVEESSK